MLRVGGGKQRSPSAVEIALSASASGWLACWLWQKLMGTMWQSTRERVGGCQVFLRICVCIYVSAYLLSHLFCSCLCDLCQQAVEMWPFPGMRNASRKVWLHILMNIWRPWSHATWFATNWNRLTNLLLWPPGATPGRGWQRGRGVLCMGTIQLPKHDWEKQTSPPSPPPLPGWREEAAGIQWTGSLHTAKAAQTQMTSGCSYTAEFPGYAHVWPKADCPCAHTMSEVSLQE